MSQVLAARLGAGGIIIDSVETIEHSIVGVPCNRQATTIAATASKALKLINEVESEVMKEQTKTAAAAAPLEGDAVKSDLLIFDLDPQGNRAAVRPSGTEPKIKFYLFAHRDPAAGRTFSSEELARAKQQVDASLASLWSEIQRDADERVR